MSYRSAQAFSALPPSQNSEIYELEARSVNPGRADSFRASFSNMHGPEMSLVQQTHQNQQSFSHDAAEAGSRDTNSIQEDSNKNIHRKSDTSQDGLNEDTITVDLTSLSGLQMDAQAISNKTGNIIMNQHKDNKSYFFPEDPDTPNWRPVVLHWPYVLTLASISLGLAAMQEYIFRRSGHPIGLLRFGSLNDLSVPVYFLWRYFPTMVMVLYGVAYQMIEIEAKRLEPYYRLAQRNGATVAQSLNVDATNFWTWFRPPFPGSARTRLSTIVSFLAVAVAPIIQNATLRVEPSFEDDFVLRVQLGWSRSLTATFALISVISLILLHPLRQRTGLISDPGGISGLLGMSTRSHILSDFQGIDVRSSDKTLASLLSHRRYILHKSSLWQAEFIPKIESTSQNEEPPQDHPFTLPLSQGVPSLLFILLLSILVPIFIFTPANIVLDKLPFLMTALGIAVKLLWTLFDTNIRLTEPYYHLVRRNAWPDVLTVDYTGTVSFALPFKALKHQHPTLAIVSLNTIFLEILTVCLSSFSTKGTTFMHRKTTAPSKDVLEGNAETFRSFWISFILSILILLSLCATAVFVYVQRRDVSLPRKPGSLAFVLLITHQSKALVNFVGTDQLTGRHKQVHLEKLGKSYGFGWYVGRDGEMHCGIDEEPLYYSYKEGLSPMAIKVHGSGFENC